MFEKVVSASIGLVFLASPAFALALSADVQSKIDALLVQIKELQALIVKLQGGPPSTSCVTLNNTLTLGSKDTAAGSDVTRLQNYLIAKGYLDAQYATGYYGFITAQAVGKLQMNLGIVSSANDTAYGIMGPRTRAAIGCGKQTTISSAATFSASPTSGAAPVIVTFSSENAPTGYWYRVNFGDGQTSEVEGRVSFIHTYITSGTYTASLERAGVECGNTTSLCTFSAVGTTNTVTITITPATTQPTATIDQSSLTPALGRPTTITGTASSVASVYVYMPANTYTGSLDYASISSAARSESTTQHAIIAYPYPSIVTNGKWSAYFGGHFTAEDPDRVLVYDATSHALLTTGTLAVTEKPTATAISVSTDSSSPGFGIVAGGTTGVVTTVAKLHASGQAFNLAELNVAMSAQPGQPSAAPDVSQISAYVDNQLIGSGVFHSNSQNIWITPSRSVQVPKDENILITIKTDFSQIGTSQTVATGRLIQTLVAAVRGTDASSGLKVNANNTRMPAGVRIFKSYPTVAQVPLPSTGLVSGSNSLLRFKITANPSGSIGLKKVMVNIGAPSAQLGLVTLYAYADAAYSQPVPGWTSGVLASENMIGKAGADLHFALQGDSILGIPSGATYYFDVVGSVGTLSAGDRIRASLIGDQRQQWGMSAYSTLQNLDFFIWSPNSTSTSLPNYIDWTNGYGIPGLQAEGITQ